MDAPYSAGAEYSKLPGFIAQTHPDCLRGRIHGAFTSEIKTERFIPGSIAYLY
jgi:hypothetical protein